MIRDTSANRIFLIAIIFLILTTIVYEIFPPDKITSFASFLSATGTLGILILTAFYVVFANRQISELKKQRELQLQPLPNIRVTEGAIGRPFLTHNPAKGDIKPALSIYLKCNIENVGNAAAVLVDCILEIHADGVKNNDDKLWARRFHVVKEKEDICFVEELREHSSQLLRAFNQTQFTTGCPKGRRFSIIVRAKILYKNILGIPFLLTLDHLVKIDMQYKDTLAKWIGIIDSFEQDFAERLLTCKAVFQRSYDDSLISYRELLRDFINKFPNEQIPLKINAWPVSYKVSHLEATEVDELEKKIHHSVPVNIETDSIIISSESPTFESYVQERVACWAKSS